MFLMSVTLEVSRLSGWLNAGARCRVETGAMRRGEVQGRGRERGGGIKAAQVVCREMPEWISGAWHARVFGAHIKHVLHFSDAGRVETQRLIEGRRSLPNRKEGI